MGEERFIIMCLYPFALYGAYHFFKWVRDMDNKNGMNVEWPPNDPDA